MNTEVKDVVADLGKAKIALFDGEEVDWIAASAAIDRAISLLESLSSQAEALTKERDEATAEVRKIDGSWAIGNRFNERHIAELESRATAAEGRVALLEEERDKLQSEYELLLKQARARLAKGGQ